MNVRCDGTELAYKLPCKAKTEPPHLLRTMADAQQAIDAMARFVWHSRTVDPMLRIINMVRVSLLDGRFYLLT